MPRLRYLFICLLFAVTVTGYSASFIWHIQSKPGISIPLGVLWEQAKYFTIWSNVLVMLLAGWMVLRRRMIPDSLFAACSLWLTIVMTVWHVLLGDGTAKHGLDALANLLGHTVIPLMLLGIWAGLAPKSKLRWRDPAIWLAWPFIYVCVALTRGLLTGFYPYFFLNLAELGWPGFLMWCLRFFFAFYLLGLVFVALGKAIPRITQKVLARLAKYAQRDLRSQ